MFLLQQVAIVSSYLPAPVSQSVSFAHLPPALQGQDFHCFSLLKMLSALLVAALAGVTSAIPTPQEITIPAHDLAAHPVLFTVPLDVVSNTPQKAAPALVKPITSSTLKAKRGEILTKRNGTCATQPAGSGPIPTPDTADAFMADPKLQVHHHRHQM